MPQGHEDAENGCGQQRRPGRLKEGEGVAAEPGFFAQWAHATRHRTSRRRSCWLQGGSAQRRVFGFVDVVGLVWA